MLVMVGAARHRLMSYTPQPFLYDTTGKESTLSGRGNESLIIPTCARLQWEAQKMKPLAVSPPTTSRVCIHLCLVLVSGTISSVS